MNNVKKTSLKQLSADKTRGKILKAARKLFVIHGFAGTSIGKIATLASVNHSLIFHHFKNKEGLWKAVKQNIVEESNSYSKSIPDLTPSFYDFLKQLITQSIQFYQKNPDIIRMISWQRLELKNKKDIGISLSPEAQRWLHALKHYQDKGDIHASAKLEFVLTYILSIISSLAMDPNVFVQKDTDLNAYILFVVKQLSYGLKLI